jgi:hypothetical protein
MAISLSTAADPLAAALAALVPPLEPLATAFSSLTNAVQRTVNQMEGWAKALSPATVAVFERSLDNLAATMGQATVPMFQSLVGVVDKLAGALSPLAATLGPIFRDLADGLTRPILDLAHAFAEVGGALAGAFAYLLPVITATADVISLLLAAGIAALVQETIALAQSMTGAQSGLEMMRSSAQQAAKEVLLFAARLAASLGGVGFVDNLIRFIERQDNARGLQAAPQNVRVEDFASIARDMVQGSFAAGPGGAQKDQKEFLRDILDELKNIRNFPPQLERVIEQGVKDIIAAIARLFPETFKNAAREALNGAGIRDTAAGRILDNLLPRL